MFKPGIEKSLITRKIIAPPAKKIKQKLTVWYRRTCYKHERRTCIDRYCEQINGYFIITFKNFFSF